MTLPSSGSISLSQIRTEFGGSTPTNLSSYYRGGAYVPSTATSVPTSGAISLSQFYGASASAVVNYVSNGTFTVDLSNWNIYSWTNGTTEIVDSSVASQSTGRLRLTCINSTQTYPTAVATLSGLTSGATYTVSLNYYTGDAVIYIGNGLLYNDGLRYTSAVQSGGTSFSFTFVATQATHYLQLESEATAVNAYTEFDNVTVYQTLLALTLSTLSATTNSSWSSTINGRSPGSTLGATSNDGTTLTVSGSTVSGTFTTSGNKTITLTETVAVASNSRRASTQTVSVATSSQFVVNGTFDTDVSGWTFTAYISTLGSYTYDPGVASWNGDLRLTCTNAVARQYPTAQQLLTGFTSGQVYTVTGNYYYNDAVISIVDGTSGVSLYYSGVLTGGTSFSFTFTAASSSAYIYLQANVFTLNAYTEFDNISVTP
jgi:hypothetical protein